MIISVVGARDRSSIKNNPRYKGMERDKLRDFMKSLAMLDELEYELKYPDVIFLRRKLIPDLQKMYGDSVSVVTIGCDDGIGAIVKQICIERHIYFTEISCLFVGQEGRPRYEPSKFYLARNAALFEVSDEFHILANEQNNGMAGDLFTRVSKTENRTRPYRLYNMQCELTERFDPTNET